MNLRELFQDKKPIFGVVMMTTMFVGINSMHAQVVSGTINGHDYIDLGLSVKWATCNVGACMPSDYGDYYAWGETSTKSTYTEKISKTYGKKKMVDIKGDSHYDAARENWGGSWRIPTREEMQELVDSCTWTWTIQDGHSGYCVTGPNGKSIFFPTAGFRSGEQCFHADLWGDYWSSTPSGKASAYGMRIHEEGTGYWVDWLYRDDGRSIRPVTE